MNATPPLDEGLGGPSYTRDHDRHSNSKMRGLELTKILHHVIMPVTTATDRDDRSRSLGKLRRVVIAFIIVDIGEDDDRS
jgi:hypothetical protein